MNAKENATMYEMIPVVSELNKVQGFNPLKFLRVTKEGIKKLDLKYKKLWFRLKYPTGRIKSFTVKVTEQIAIMEARVYFDKNDEQPRASFIAQRDKDTTPGGLYIEAAQHAAIDQALSDAGFGVQFIPCNAEQNVEPVEKQPEVVQSETKVVEQTQQSEEVTTVETENVVVEQVIESQATTETVVEEPEGEEVVEDEAEKSTGTAIYTKDMPVEEICRIMTLGEARDVIVPIGSCKDWTLAQVADRRPASLKWYIHGYDGDDNILRAAATLVRADYEEKLAA